MTTTCNSPTVNFFSMTLYSVACLSQCSYLLSRFSWHVSFEARPPPPRVRIWLRDYWHVYTWSVGWVGLPLLVRTHITEKDGSQTSIIAVVQKNITSMWWIYLFKFNQLSKLCVCGYCIAATYTTGKIISWYYHSDWSISLPSRTT